MLWRNKQNPEARVFRRGSFVLFLLCLLPGLGCEPFVDTLDFERRDAPIFRARELQQPAPTSELKVMAWNLKFGAGRVDFFFDFWGDRVQMSLDEVEANMEGIYQLIREYDPDVVLASEVDVNSRRSAFVDMVQGLLDNTGLNYGSYHQTWNVRYAPYNGIGGLDMGNAILSKYPIVKAEDIRQQDRTDLNPVYELLYLHRVVGRAEIEVGARRVAAFVVHTEAYDQDGTKSRQLDQVHRLMKEETLPFVCGGDFNELPPGSVRVVDFPDERASSKGTDFEQPPYSPEDMRPFFDDFNPAITLEMYGETEETQQRYYTHSILGPHMTGEMDGLPGFWNRTLDYLFIRPDQEWKAGSTDVLQSPGRLDITSDPMLLSDHAPVVGTWVLP